FAAARGSETALGQLFPAFLKIARDHAEVLAGYGQAPGDLTDGEALAAHLDQADETQEAAKVEGHSDTEARNLALNDLVDRVNTITRTGRRTFRHQPEKKLLF